MSEPSLAQADAKAVEGLLDSFGHLFASGDMEGWAALFHDRSDFISWGGVWWTTREENLAAHRSIPPAIAAQLPAYRSTTVKWRALGPDVVLAHGRWDWPGFVADDGPPEDRAGLLTIVLHKSEEGWRIRAVHNTRIPDTRIANNRTAE